MKLYTKTGDDGTTGLFGGARVKKSSDRVEAYGTVDELNATLGLARAHGLSPFADGVLGRVQSELFVLGAELACVPGKEASMKMQLLGPEDSAALEAAIDEADAGAPPLQSFVLPGGSLASASLHLARTVCRRAERGVLVLAEAESPPRGELVIYLNRLSDLLFALARYENVQQNVADVPWAPRGL